ncbi:MAG: DUF167 domain-containing protein [Chloroflexia bacterium]|nr:DUF167 domain-containing protein [Chloroflexia bacterium]
MAITDHPRGSTLALAVVPRASRTGIECLADGTVRVRLSAPPVDGAANVALLRFLANILHIPRSRLAIASGEASRRKRVLVAGIASADLAACVQAALERHG